ncbi:helix-turn-helix domain-containing protein [Nocardiopsis sp. NRRL B-16309]|uniref:helix-turn-helix domain-containing protein n=1 Tax=Nocardiopsis sp. NRRL B-16309 TaxID=1519494 RepID=UPI0006B02DE5|nr:helix-turn-helix domain-containing protein [Nocardiopsis sp. NRRL B-16309]KOX10195.1 hypothetical protein ADL05_26345 [Nocardiopsis sp. NRRL B-16309]
MSEKALYTPAEAAELLGVNKRTIYRMIAAGEFPRLVDVRRRGSQRSRTRIRREDLQRHIDRATRSVA